jgi:hypothetical protein
LRSAAISNEWIRDAVAVRYVQAGFLEDKGKVELRKWHTAHPSCVTVLAAAKRDPLALMLNTYDLAKIYL